MGLKGNDPLSLRYQRNALPLSYKPMMKMFHVKHLFLLVDFDSHGTKIVTKLR